MSGSKGPTRLAAVISHPIQHFAPMFRELAKAPDITLRVFYACDWGIRQYHDPEFGKAVEWDVPLLEGYDHVFLPANERPRTMSFREVDNPSVGAALEEFRPDAVWVFGYSYRTYLRALRWSHRAGTYTMFFGDSQLLTPRSWLKRAVKRLYVSWVYSLCDAFITIGDNNEDYYLHYGVRPEQMFRGAYPVEISRFRQAVAGMTVTEKRVLRERYGLHEANPTFLFCGKFIARKRPLDLIHALARLKDRDVAAQALFIGAGELESTMRDLAEKLGLADRVRIAGFVNQAEMPRVLHLGDALVMSSDDDPHPLVVTESMAVGNAIIASDRTGCVGPTDSARPGVNTLTYATGNTAQLAARIEELARDAALRQRLQQGSRELADTQDVSVTVAAARRALAAR